MFEDNSQNKPLSEVILRRSSESLYPDAKSGTKSRKKTSPPGKTTPDFEPIRRSDFPQTDALYPRVKKGRGLWWKILVSAAIIGVIFFGTQLFKWGGKIFQNNSPFSFFSSLGQLFISSDRPVAGEDKGVVNILLLGIGGEGHEGANLTDTIILASIKLSADKTQAESVSLLSVPRDLLARLPDGLEWRKINSAYAYGELKQKGQGAKWITNIMKDLAGEQIPYYGVLDFAGFRQAIDDLGGIDVNIQTSFSDSSYPDYRKGYLPTIRFNQGTEHMNGERALEFARSRHGNNGEGTDFARSRRQQEILSATKNKISKLHLTSISTVSKLLNNFADHFRTNFQPWEIKRLYDLLKNIKSENINSLSLDPSTGIVCSEILPENGAYVLSYCPGKNKTDIRNFAEHRFETASLTKESPKILIQNSTKTPGLASLAQNALQKYNFEITSENYPEKREFPLTTIYDLTNGSKPQTLNYLKNELSAYVASSQYPFEDKLSEPKPDFIIVLGADAPSKIKFLIEKNTPKTPPAKEPAGSVQKP